jgi:Flp pilus assembly protein TadD
VQDDREALRGVLHRLNEVRGGQTVVASVRAQLALREGNRDLALSHLRDAVEGGTENTRLIRQLMRFEMLRGNEGRAVDAARSLLRIIPGDASAHYIIGKVQMMRGDLDLAEDSLRRSIEQRRSVKALNDLAWLLQEKGEHQDAEELAREAVAKTPELGEAWDTLGVILMRQERFEEARKALNKALAFSSRKAPARLSMAELEAITGDLDAAKSLLEQVKEKMRMGAEIDPKRISRVQRIIDGTSRK